jgi:hypothetical protein
MFYLFDDDDDGELVLLLKMMKMIFQVKLVVKVNLMDDWKMRSMTMMMNQMMMVNVDLQ